MEATLYHVAGDRTCAMGRCGVPIKRRTIEPSQGRARSALHIGFALGPLSGLSPFWSLSPYQPPLHELRLFLDLRLDCLFQQWPILHAPRVLYDRRCLRVLYAWPPEVQTSAQCGAFTTAPRGWGFRSPWLLAPRARGKGLMVEGPLMHKFCG
jgi:hypothetical protein